MNFMPIWGKIGGAAAGFVLGGGPIGALLGALAGHFLVDREADPEIVFTLGVIALSAKMAKADGAVHDEEYTAFLRMVHVPREEERNVRRVFDFARRDVAGYEAYATQIANLFKAKPGVLEDLMDGLFLIALADGDLHPAEVAYLKRVAEIFGFSDAAFARMRVAHGAADESDPYTILNIFPDATDEEVRRAYLRGVKDNHPDMLVARGVPEDFVAVATEKLARINTAYDKIKAQRGSE